MICMTLSRHSAIRARQRGIACAQIEAVERYADVETPRGGGCVSIWISRKMLQELGPSTPEGIATDRLQGLIVLVGNNQACVTVLRSQRTKTYRRNTRR